MPSKKKIIVCPLWLPVSSAVLGNGIPVMRRSQGSTPYDFDRCPHRGGLHLENPCDRQFFTQSFRSKIIAPEKMSQFQNSPRIYAENERFPSGFPSSLRSTYAFDVKTGQAYGRGLGLS